MSTEEDRKKEERERRRAERERRRKEEEEEEARKLRDKEERRKKRELAAQGEPSSSLTPTNESSAKVEQTTITEDHKVSQTEVKIDDTTEVTTEDIEKETAEEITKIHKTTTITHHTETVHKENDDDEIVETDDTTETPSKKKESRRKEMKIELSTLRSQLDEKDSQLLEKDDIIAEKDKQIATLTQKVKDLEHALAEAKQHKPAPAPAPVSTTTTAPKKETSSFIKPKPVEPKPVEPKPVEPKAVEPKPADEPVKSSAPTTEKPVASSEGFKARMAQLQESYQQAQARPTKEQPTTTTTGSGDEVKPLEEKSVKEKLALFANAKKEEPPKRQPIQRANSVKDKLQAFKAFMDVEKEKPKSKEAPEFTTSASALSDSEPKDQPEPTPASEPTSTNQEETPKEPAKEPVRETKPKKFGTWSASNLKQMLNSDLCEICSEVVYATEKLVADNKIFHKACFKCTSCKAVLKLGNYASMDSVFYCKPCFKKNFMSKGNYSEGFGRLKPQQEYEQKKGPETQN